MTPSRSTPKRPLAVTLGDPAGVGPEIIVKTWHALKESGPAFLVVGDHAAIVSAAGAAGAGIAQRISSPDEAMAVFPSAVPVLDSPLLSPVVAGKPSSRYASSVVRWIETAVGLTLSGSVGGVVTAPVAKAPLYEAGFPFPGHTEFLAELTAGEPMEGERGPVMMLTAADLRAALVTVHQPLREALDAITIDRVVHVGRVANEALVRDFGLVGPRLALAGLNPHAGEEGNLGREEQDILFPAAKRLRAEAIDCTDPRPADTLFHPEARRGYDMALCLYHDQALIPVKTIDFWGGVNVTLGLPIVRTSPDHGVAYDIAGRGLARADSLIAAIKLASQIAARRESWRQRRA